MTATESPYNPSIAIHPGVTLHEELEFLSISHVEFARRAGLSNDHSEKILSGERPITLDVAAKIERVLGGKPPAEFWDATQKSYELNLARINSLHANKNARKK
jgi:addiction module HigA family antidote